MWQFRLGEEKPKDVSYCCLQTFILPCTHESSLRKVSLADPGHLRHLRITGFELQDLGPPESESIFLSDSNWNQEVPKHFYSVRGSAQSL